MHSQEVDFNCTRLAVEPATDLMFAVSTATDGAAKESITVHSLDVEHLLAFRYRFAPPPGSAAAAATATKLISNVASLHAIGGVLSRGCVASFGSRLVVFEAPEAMPQPNATLTRPRSSWDAHPGAFVSALHLSPYAPTLYSGANNGLIHSWDLRTKPSAPAAVLAAHQRNVTGLAMVNDTCLASCGIDSKVLLWDPRRTESPYAAVCPDAAPALRLAPSPFGDCLAVSTNRGLHAVDLIDGAHAVAPIAPFPLQRPFSDIAWWGGAACLLLGLGFGRLSGDVFQFSENFPLSPPQTPLSPPPLPGMPAPGSSTPEPTPAAWPCSCGSRVHPDSCVFSVQSCRYVYIYLLQV
jgi:WD40 repeat protein